MMLIVLTTLMIVRSSISSLLIDLSEVNMKIMEHEYYKHNMMQVLQETANLLIIKNETWPGLQTDTKIHNYSKNWAEHFSLVKSNLSEECVVAEETPALKQFNNYAVLSTRTILVKQGYMYISTAYVNKQVDEKPNEYLNQLETVTLLYNSSRLWLSDVSTTNYSLKSTPLNMSDFEEFCFHNQYIHIFKESLHLCLLKKQQGREISYDLVLRRPQFKTDSVIGVIKESLIKDKKHVLNPSKNLSFLESIWKTKAIEMKLFAAEGGYLEGFVFGRELEAVYVFSINRGQVFNIHHDVFPYRVFDIHYIASTLMVFSVKTINQDQFNNAIEVEKIYYLERYPGAKLNSTNTVLMGEFNFLKGFASDEGPEIIIETYKANEPADYKLFTVIYSVYSFNLITKISSQTQTFVLYGNSHNRWSRGTLFRFDTFWLRESTMFLASTQLAGYYYINGNWEFKSERNGYWVVRDSFTGFSASTFLDRTYNLYITGYSRDLSINQYFFMPFMSEFNDDSGLKRKCTVLKQRIREYLIDIRNKLTGQAFYPYLRLTFTPKHLNQTSNILNIEFIKRDQLLDYRLWKANNQSEASITVSKQQLAMPLSKIARGSYIVQRIDPLIAASVDYPTENPSTVRLIEEKAMFKLTQTWHHIKDLRVVSFIDRITAFEIVNSDSIATTLVFYSETSSPKVTVFEVNKLNNSLEFDREFIINSQIEKVLPLINNLFILFLEDGTFELFNGTSRTGMILPYPGVNCRDIEQLYHPNIKSSIICLDCNKRFSVYYVDELVMRSLSYSLLQIVSVDHPNITLNSKLLSSEAFPGYFFVFTPRSIKLKARLSVFFVDIVERTEILFIRELDLDDIGNKLPGSYFTQGAYLVRDRIVIHYHQSLDHNCFISATFDDDMNLVFMKTAFVDTKLMIPRTEKLFPFKRHFASLDYENSDPLLAVKVHDSVTKHDKNVLVIDPFSPELETFPVMLLPRHSRTELLRIIPVYSCGADNIRKYTIGLMHSKSYTSETLSNGEDIKIMIHFVEPGIPQIMFQLDNSAKISHQNILSKKPDNYSSTIIVQIQDHLSLDKVNDLTAFDFKVKLKMIAGDMSTEQSLLRYPALEIDRQKHLSEFNNKSQATVLIRKFTSLVNRTIVDWNYYEESLFDKILHTMNFTRPMNVTWTKNAIDWRGFRNYDYFCFKYKLIGNKQECVKQGMIFIFDKSVSLTYKTNITEANEANTIKISLENDDCIEYFVVNYKLYSICNINYRQYVTAINLDTLEQGFYEQHQFPNLNSKSTEVSKLTANQVSFVRLTHSIKNLRHKRSVGGSNLIKFDEHGQGSTNFSQESVDMKLVSTIYGLFTDYMTVVHKLNMYNAFLVTEVSMAAGNQLALYIKVESTKLVSFNASVASQIYVQAQDNLQFTVSGNKETKQTALSNGKMKVIAFSGHDYSYDENILVFNSTAPFINYTGKGKPLNMSLLLHLPNYHSYIIRVFNEFKRCQMVLFRLFNPFSGLDNQYIEDKPQCKDWACVFMIKPEGKQFYLMLYDLQEDRIASVPNNTNFQRLFPEDKMNCNEATESTQSFNLDNIDETFSIYPLQILQLENVELIRFDKNHRQESDPDELALLVYYKNTSYSQVLVNRNLRIVMDNLYISSSFIQTKISRLHGVNQFMQIDVIPFREYDYFKYYLFIGACLAAALVYCICTLRALSINERIRVREIDIELGINPKDTSPYDDDHDYAENSKAPIEMKLDEEVKQSQEKIVASD